ncbi:S41 family peptidase [Gracilimonas sp. Q87]|uniref:S41 family peptidase n=1 Tax=Gracilimonas sp. Q87 TaxID=3384766 RepID=UPI0039843673
MKRSLTVFFIALFSTAVFAQVNPQWLRYPSISPDGTTIAFTYKGDLYSVAAEGGNATQLTFHEAHDYMPVWSKDGSRLAFASDRYGNFDIYVMDAKGGEATRLTFHSNDEKPYSFSRDDTAILFGAVRQDLASHRQYPTGSQPELYSVPVKGGQVDQIFTVPAEYVQLSSDGSIMLYHDKKGGENEWRKHHTSSITRDIWKYDPASGEHIMITSFEGEDRQPVFTQDEQAMYFLSERTGSFNVFKKDLKIDGVVEQLTGFELHPVRFLSMGNGTLAFGYDGELYTMKEGSEPVKVPVTVRTQSTVNEDKFITINGGVEEMAVSPDGKEIAFIARGEVFVTSVDGGMTKRITDTPETEAHVTFTPKGDKVVYASERDGKWSIYQTEIVRSEEEPFFFASSLLKETALIETEEGNYLPRFSPDGSKIAYVAGRRTLKVKDLKSGNTTDLMTPEELFHMRDGDKYFRWSPDSKWLLVGWSKLLNNSEVLLLSADGEDRYNLTESGYYDYSPKWINDGKQMIWFSNQDGLKSYATSGSFQSDVYTMFFDQESWDKFNMSEEDYKLMQEIEKVNKAEGGDDENDDEEKKEEEEVKNMNIDFDRMKDWTKKLTIHSSFMSDATLSKEGDKLYYLARFEDNYNLWETDLRTRETKMAIKLNTGGGSLTWDKDMENLYLLSRGRISKLDLSGNASKGIEIAGEMDLDAGDERQKMLDHIYIRTKNVFYEPTFHGNDWDMLYEEYQKYVPYIGNAYEFAEMVSELLGELNVSHAGAGYSSSIDNADATASLGIFMDYEHEGNGIKIGEVLEGGPLDKAGLDVESGMIIQSIDGETISPDRDVATYLNRKAGQFTLLEITDETDKKSRQVRIKPISLREEQNLLYDRFVKINAEEVRKMSNGKLGYVHIPGMSDGPYRDIYKDMLGKYYDTEAIIVDTRFNGGGDLVADLVMFFSGEEFITYATARKAVGGEPTSRWTKPTLTMFNESNYSDGHCYAQGYKDMELGLTVGMPVPGTCSFAGWEGLPNGGYWGVVPVSAKNKAGEWMENNQTEPDIKVKNQPEIISAGRDQQLEKAIEELMKQVNE